MSLSNLNDTISSCTLCPRLSNYVRDVAAQKVKRYRHEDYWGKAVPSFGDEKARALIIGLAPAAHGANRTGRMFTGDSSGDWLYGALYETGFANQSKSEYANDGMQLRDIRISSIVHCAPPQNKPSREEINVCSSYLEKELGLMPQLKVIVVLGHLAFNTFTKLHHLKGLKFAHGAVHRLPDGRILLCSYHPSRQNTQTGRLLWADWLSVFQQLRALLDAKQEPGL